MSGENPTRRGGKAEIAVDVRAQVGEGAIWSVAEEALYWTDIPAGELHRVRPADGARARWTFPSMLGCFALDGAGGAILALEDGFWRFDLESGARRFVAQPEPEKPLNRFNDGAVCPDGRFLAGTMPKAGAVEGAPEGALYLLDHDGSTRTLETGLFTQNGLAFSPEGDRLYLADSARWRRVVWAYDWDRERGAATGKRVFFDTNQVAGRPDGAAIDVDGCYWLAGVGGWQVYRITPAGVVDRVLDLPVEKPSRPCFGGPNLETLYVTTIGAVGPDGAGDPAQPLAGAIFAFSNVGQGLETPTANIAPGDGAKI